MDSVDKPSVIRRSRTVRGAPYAIETFEWPHPTQPGRVCRHWFDTKDEALQALQGRSPWLADLRRFSTDKPVWLLPPRKGL